MSFPSGRDRIRVLRRRTVVGRHRHCQTHPIDREQAPQSNLDRRVDLQVAPASVPLYPFRRIGHSEVRLTPRHPPIKCAGSQIGDGLQMISLRDPSQQSENLRCLRGAGDRGKRCIEPVNVSASMRRHQPQDRLGSFYSARMNTGACCRSPVAGWQLMYSNVVQGSMMNTSCQVTTSRFSL